MKNLIGSFNPESGIELIPESLENTPSPIESVGRTVYTIIAKPTRACNADCSYCCAPPYDKNKWTLEKFKRYFDKIEPYLADGATWIWHGGEPMMMGPQFFVDAKKYCLSQGSNISFSMQSNILLYKTKKWRDVFDFIFDGSVSTSYEPDDMHRTISGNPALYSEKFHRGIRAMVSDGFSPMVIGTFDKFNIDYADELISFSNKLHNELGHGVNIRVNYKKPIGRHKGGTDLISPESYGRKLVALLDDWVKYEYQFSITPLDQMIKSYLEMESSRCPWTNSCAGRFMGIEPNGDVYNCDDFAELRDPRYKFGNLNTHSVPELFNSPAHNNLFDRNIDLPDDCINCKYLHACRGGCARDAVAYNEDNDVLGKYHYCESWKMVFSKIETLIVSGEINKILKIITPTAARF